MNAIYYGYYTRYGYWGLVLGRWMIFATENEYKEYLEEQCNESSQ